MSLLGHVGYITPPFMDPIIICVIRSVLLLAWCLSYFDKAPKTWCGLWMLDHVGLTVALDAAERLGYIIEAIFKTDVVLQRSIEL